MNKLKTIEATARLSETSWLNSPTIPQHTASRVIHINDADCGSRVVGSPPQQSPLGEAVRSVCSQDKFARILMRRSQMTQSGERDLICAILACGVYEALDTHEERFRDESFCRERLPAIAAAVLISERDIFEMIECVIEEAARRLIAEWESPLISESLANAEDGTE